MVDDHEDAVNLFKSHSESGKDPELKAFAAKTLPVLQGHLNMIKDIKAKMK
jgi:putative membrane protein